MNARKFVKFNMYRTVEKLCNENASIINRNPGFMESFGNFTSIISQIEAANDGASEITTGITADKNDDKDAVCDRAAKIAGFVFAYASRINNNTLKESVSFSVSDLQRQKKEALLTAVNKIYDAANNNQPDVANFGATATVLAAFQAEIAAYKASVHSPRVAQTTKGTHNENLEKLFKNEDLILTEQMDKTVLAFEETFPDFVTAYRKARIIIDAPSGGKTEEKPAQ